ncbi:DUF2461 domain-containing protein [Aestuariimicrobium kwangyangense]|uniref:DUF2461 domain-containing protein n=1 Tax=Aestuariimicrobium kwangyangense TaxID=396389 RepID=UPI0003B598E4|nr:DUF2461 domain-containing protein [Aestuariimicrobium kwangyangense]
MSFSQATFDFYRDLEVDNSREFWTARRQDWEEHVRQPMLELVEALAGEFGEAKIFRPNRDVRFAKDKSPYKTHQGAWVPVGPAMGWYVQVSADGLMTGGGFYHAEPAVLKSFREAVNGDGGTLQRRLDELPRAFEVAGDRLVRVPRGYDPEHPRAELLRHTTLTVGRRYPTLPANVVSQVRRDWRALLPVIDWLDEALADV